MSDNLTDLLGQGAPVNPNPQWLTTQEAYHYGFIVLGVTLFAVGFYRWYRSRKKPVKNEQKPSIYDRPKGAVKARMKQDWNTGSTAGKVMAFFKRAWRRI